MADDDKLRDAVDALVAVDHQKARILMNTERDFETANDGGAASLLLPRLR
jgi:hypothetical protein